MGNYATAAAQAKSFSRSPKKKLRRSGLSARHLFRVAFWLQQANPSDAVQLITSGLATSQVTGTTFWLPLYEFLRELRCTCSHATRANQSNEETPMAQEARELICMITSGTDHEFSSIGFTIANGGITAGLKVFIFLSAVASTLCGSARRIPHKSIRSNLSLNSSTILWREGNNLGLHSLR